MDLEVLRSQDLSFWDPLRSRTPPDLGVGPQMTPFGPQMDPLWDPLWTPKMALLQLPRVATRAS